MIGRRRSGPEVDPEQLVAGYLQGAFPMDAPERARAPIEYFVATPRAVLPIGDGFHVPRTVRRRLRAAGFEIRIDRAFDAVLEACAEREEGTWLSPRLARAYRTLHARGLAHSVEAWREETLVGGLFGVALGGLFTSESMFHRVSDAGNAALVATHARLLERGYTLWDIQTATDHTRRFGLLEMSHQEYLALLRTALEHPRDFGGSADASRVR
ncbi:MAG: leucyl/phenylalanyl-tRNA--protein transferase [Thermoleophilia bacterium]